MMRFVLLSLLLLLSSAFPCAAKETFNFQYFSLLPVQHEGRIKPLDTLARASLKTFSGRDHLKDMDATTWLAGTLFNPAQALEQPLFRVLKPDVAGLEPRENSLYSFTDIVAALKTREQAIARLQTIPEKNWSDDQRELMRLHEHSLLYLQLLRSFSSLLPLNLTIPVSLQNEWEMKQNTPVTIQDLQPYEARLAKKIEGIVRRKGDNLDHYTETEKEIAAFAFELGLLKQGGENNLVLRIVPAKDTWFSPWTAMQAGQGKELLGLWQKAAAAYNKGDIAGFEKSTADLRQLYAPPSTVQLERLYNQAHPLGSTMLLYLLSFLAFAGYRLSGKGFMKDISFLSLLTGCAVHAFAIAGRIIILERPPVGTLYESILFVSLICVLFALFLEWRRKDGLGILIGTLCGLLMLFISGSFSGEDSMQVLVAVLNTNFWLGTHVLCITIGYGVCIITASLAHLSLLQQAFGKHPDTLSPVVRTTGLMALLFTAVGTILGGIWADQSWGRFWGWDPKENGALLIVLWLIWVYHGSLSGHMRKTAFTVALASLNIVVALAWFGVNLLNVGLHSYGFITGVAAGLGAFCLIEMIIIGFLWHRIYKRVQA